MGHNRSFVIDFAVKVFLPSAAAAACLFLLILHVFNAVFQDTNELDNAYARRAAQAALQSLRDGMENLVQDNAHWDDAVSHTYGRPDLAWLGATWSVTDSQELYDAAFVVDADNKTVFASIRADPASTGKTDLFGYFSADITKVLANLPSSGSEFVRTSAIIGANGSPSVVAAAVIIPWSEDMALPSPRPLRLVLAKTLGPNVLAKLAKDFVLGGLHLTAPGENPAVALTLTSPGGDRLATLAWNDRSPGTALRIKFSNIVWAVLILFLLVVGVLVYMSWRGFKQANESRAEAIGASLRDDLTGLANRRQLMKVLTEKLAEARASKHSLSVVYADLDGFKEVNDAYGHEIGDQLLKSAATGFQFLAEGLDLVARLGGDEFAVIVSGESASLKARNLARNMIAFLAEPMVFGGRVASVSVSAGIVDLAADDADVEEILRRADVAMYSAKAAGRNRVHIFDPSFDANRDEKRAISRDLRSAIDERELVIVYQPIVEARSRRTVGVEALVRWPANAAVSYPPEVFVPVAEEFGLIEDLGRLVLQEACTQAAGWPGIFVTVNVSPIQFMNPGFAEIVEHTLKSTGLGHGRLEIEVTEGFVIDNAIRATNIIDRLHDLGVTVALDDFGTGYSSIGHLRRFKFDKLKLDRSMVQDILHQPAALRLVQGTIAMADALNLRVTAEGIEDENQVSVLRLAGCSMFQGFLFSRPVAAEDVPDLLSIDMGMAEAVG